MSASLTSCLIIEFRTIYKLQKNKCIKSIIMTNNRNFYVRYIHWQKIYTFISLKFNVDNYLKLNVEFPIKNLKSFFEIPKFNFILYNRF